MVQRELNCCNSSFIKPPCLDYRMENNMKISKKNSSTESPKTKNFNLSVGHLTGEFKL